MELQLAVSSLVQLHLRYWQIATRRNGIYTKYYNIITFDCHTMSALFRMHCCHQRIPRFSIPPIPSSSPAYSCEYLCRLCILCFLLRRLLHTTIVRSDGHRISVCIARLSMQLRTSRRLVISSSLSGPIVEIVSRALFPRKP